MRRHATGDTNLKDIINEREDTSGMVTGRGIMGNATLIGRITEGELSTSLKSSNPEFIF